MRKKSQYYLVIFRFNICAFFYIFQILSGNTFWPQFYLELLKVVKNANFETLCVTFLANLQNVNKLEWQVDPSKFWTSWKKEPKNGCPLLTSTIWYAELVWQIPKNSCCHPFLTRNNENSFVCCCCCWVKLD